MSDRDTPLAPEVRELVGTLRGAGLSPEALAGVRQSVVSGAGGTGGGIGGSGFAGVYKLFVVVVALVMPVVPGEARAPVGTTVPVSVTSETIRDGEARRVLFLGGSYAPPSSRALDGARSHEQPASRAVIRTPLTGAGAPGARGLRPLARGRATAGGSDGARSAKMGPDIGGPGTNAPPSEAFAGGVRHYANGDYLDGVGALLPVIEGRSGDSRATAQRAWFFLARALYHLGLYHSSAIAFDAITREGETHPHFEASLPWLARLAERIAEPSGVIESIGRYRREELSALGQAGTKREYDRVLYLLGRDRYAGRDLSGAVALFRELGPDSAHYVEARFYEGVSHVRMRRARPAVRAFRDVIAAVEEGNVGEIDDPDRMRDLAWLSLARVYYSAANRRGDDGGLHTDERLLNNAIDAWNRVPESSEHWLDATFEQSWALFVAGQSDRALGKIHALLSPYFDDRHYPEAHVVRAVVLFQHCQLDASQDAVEAFHARYDAELRGLRAALDRHGEPPEALALLRRTRAGHAPVPREARDVVTAALTDRALLRHLAHVDGMAEEEGRLAELTRGRPRLAAASAWLGQELAIAKALAEDRAGELVAGRLERAAEELQRHMNEVDAVQLEIHTERRRRPDGYPERDGEIHTVADQEHMVWPFDGEYWRDELPYYRVQVPDRCTR